TLMLSLSDLIFSGGGGNDEDIRTVRDLVLENKMIWYGEVGGVETDSSVSNASVFFTTSSSSSSSDDSLSSLSYPSTGWSAGSSSGSSSSPSGLKSAI
ncbi:hypothetical protein Tco_0325959, partial [Tanacetum coccineum]